MIFYRNNKYLHDVPECLLVKSCPTPSGLPIPVTNKIQNAIQYKDRSPDWWCLVHGPLTRYAKLQVAHAPGMPGTFSPAADFEGNRYLAIPACITARAWRTCRDACRDRLPAVTGKTFPAFPAHAHPQFCVSGKRPILWRQREREVVATDFLRRPYATPEWRWFWHAS